jgi:hypothetical protein
MISWSSFSQNDTVSSKIQLTKPVAKLVVKDLISGDGLKLELKTIKEVLEETNGKLETQTMLVSNLQTQVTNFVTILDQKDLQLDTSSELSNALEKQLKKEARTKKFYQITSAVGAAAILLLLIQK